MCGRCSVRKACTSGPPSAGSPRRVRVTSTGGTSWRSPLSSREMVLTGEREPASAEAMELNYLMLEQRRLEDRIGEAGEQGEVERRAELSRERARLVERIAHTERIAS